MAARHRRNLHAQLATRGLSGHCYFDSDGNFCCPGPNGIECTGPSGTFTQRSPWQARPVVPPRTPDWPTRLAANPGPRSGLSPVDPFQEIITVVDPVDPFGRAQARHARQRLVARSRKPARYSSVKRAFGL